MAVYGTRLKVLAPKPKPAPRPAAYRLPACPTCGTRGRQLAGRKLWCPSCVKGFPAP